MLQQSGLKTFRIDQEDYQFGLLDPETAMKTWVRFLKMGLGPFGSLLSKVSLKGGKVDIGDIDFDLSEALQTLALRMDEQEVMDLIHTMLSQVRDKNGAELVFAVQFIGRIGHLLKVVGKAVEVNYADFFGVFGGLIKKMPMATSQGKTTLTGKSGGSSSQK